MENYSFPSSFSTRSYSNLDRLLQSLMPKVPSTPIPQSCIQEFNMMWNPGPNPITKYFTLRDLWLSFEKWSAYGAKTKVMVTNREEVDQFFVPSLSAIQIFTNKPHESIRLRSKKTPFKNLFSNQMDVPPQSDFFYKPYFEFHEKVSPYNRPPLFETIKKFSKSDPGLKNLTSIDLTPASWMCVAWYPICQIPNIGIPIKDFDAAFLTFHSISSFYQDLVEEDMKSSGVQNGGNQSISLPPFGCATYKFEGNIWLNHGDADYMRLFNLNTAADWWIRELGFEHHDFNFFTRQNAQQVAYAEPAFFSYYDNGSGFLQAPDPFNHF